ncbi:hypothetical protein BHYA_0202g00190 [Botrytis hyacinthi]|uniref:Uncharacterized protein n=1 Tax=Botrytis hyacinthi TaxID=278943 RepID=A0A4Z1GBL6_9HELO|nr:hypothetical protein BHYA_0202g00190 [Botrytis hyacinthi]
MVTQNQNSTIGRLHLQVNQNDYNISRDQCFPRNRAESESQLLDFPSVSEWHKGLVKSITPLDPVDPLAENSPNKFAWQGPPVMTVSGLHSFLIESSKSNPSGTTFTQMEVYSGGVSFLMQPWLIGKPIKGQFEKYNADLKKKCKSL